MKKIPDTLSLIGIIMIIFIALTWIIPAGEYDYTEFQGRNAAIPGTYHKVESSPQGIFDLLMAPLKGFISAAQIIGFCFIVGGAFGILNRTGAINAGLLRVIEKNRENKQNRKMILVIIMILFSIAGASFGMSESVLVFIMITIPLALALGYDSIIGISISFLAAGVGFAGALTNPFTIGIAQGIAGLQIFSGWEYRLIIWIILTATAIIYVLRYAAKIERDPEKSPVFQLDKERDEQEMQVAQDLEFHLKRRLIVYFLFASLLLIVVGSNIWSWYINEITALFLALGIIAAIIYRLPVKETSLAFIKGAKDMLLAGIIIAMSKGLLVIATEGKIIDTLLYALAGLSENAPVVVSAGFMFIFQGVLNFFVPSGSGQAALTMPIMAPLSDLVGITRQTAVLCFQMGDGIFNMIIPTSGVTMGVLSISRIPYSKWFRWLLPLIIIFTLLALLFLIPPVLLFEYS
jgi:uncharacterized ion transporter superfamily protein YfcC